MAAYNWNYKIVSFYYSFKKCSIIYCCHRHIPYRLAGYSRAFRKFEHL